MSETKKVIYGGPYPVVSIDGVGQFERCVPAAIDAAKADELVMHKGSEVEVGGVKLVEFSLADGEEKPTICPCDTCTAKRAKEEAQKPAPIQTTGRTDTRRGMRGVAIGDASTDTPASSESTNS